MRFGMIGLGRMGANLSHQAISKGHQVVGYDPAVTARNAAAATGVTAVASLDALAKALQPPRVITLYVPHGTITEEVCQTLAPLLETHDIVMDGGNSHWKDSERRAGFFKARGIRFLDVGTTPSPVIAHSQQALMQFRDLDSPAAKAHALLRNAYGGHPVHRVTDAAPRR